MANKKTISVLVPAYNEQANIAKFYKEISKVLDKFKNKYKFEIIFINDGSSDKTQAEILKLAKSNKDVRYIEFVRNFGKEIALSAGLNECKGDCAIQIDSDLQHPVKLIPKFIKAWESGAEHVVGIRKVNNGYNFFKKITSRMFYDFINRVSHTRLVPGITDFQLIDRLVIDEFNKFTERGRITRGLLSWLGFPVTYIEFKPNERHAGQATYNTFKLMQLATNSFVSLSLFPLKIAGYLGLIISLLSGFMGLYMYVDRYILHDPFNFNFTGTAFLAMLLMFLVGVVLSCLGLVALYIGAIHEEVLNRPLYIIRKKNL